MIIESPVSVVPLKVWTDRSILKGRSWVPLFLPHWGKFHPDHDSHPYSSSHAEYASDKFPPFTITDLASSECAVLPYEWGLTLTDPEARHEALSFVKKASDSGRWTVAFHFGDAQVTIPEGTKLILCKASCRKSLMGATEIAIPFWGGDVRQMYQPNGWHPAPISSRPSIGFCGASYARSGFHPFKTVREWAGKAFRAMLGKRHDNPLAIRGQALLRLQRSKFCSADFRFHASSWLAQPHDVSTRFQRLQESHRDYAENILRNPYTVCVRGGGNFSVRFYEVLSAGRIPIFIDTDCVLPLENQIPWRELCVWVAANDVNRIDRTVFDFHQSRGNDGLIEHQRRILGVYTDFVSPKPFYRSLARRVRELSQRNP